MLCSLIKVEFVDFLRRTMGCFFGCFRVKDDSRPPIHLLSQPISSTPKDPVESVSKNRLSSLLLFEAEDSDQSPLKDRKCIVLGSATPINLNELKAEAKFLKACGTLPQTPAEIRNNEKLTDSERHNGDTESSKFHSWLPNASIENLKPEKHPDQQPSPVNLFEAWENGSDSSSHSPHSCLTGQNSERLYFSSAEGCGVKYDVETVDLHSVPSTKCRNKSVQQFDYEIDASSYSLTSTSSQVTCQEPKPSGLSGDYSASKSSPYPTPLTLTNDMQTPGTVFPAHSHNMEIGKIPRIRSPYVYQVVKPVENAAQLKAMMKESSNSDYESVQLEDHLEKGANTTGKELSVDASLSSWLPPKQAQQGHNNRSFIGRTPGDRPILGMVAAHWNADETVSSPTKWWDGNGIPNSTNKYKEDQKVSWHATPFEERLEKALSEDKLIAERKQLRKVTLPPIALEEKEGRETSNNFESGYFLINSS